MSFTWKLDGRHSGPSAFIHDNTVPGACLKKYNSSFDSAIKRGQRLIRVRRLIDKIRYNKKRTKLMAGLYHLTDENKRSYQMQLEAHQKDGDAGYKEKKGDKAAAIKSWTGKRREVGGQFQPRRKDAVDMLTFDFQQNLPTPNLKHQEMFYARQLWMFNFGVHDCVSNKGYMFMWPETTAKRGASEVISCLETFLTENSTGAR